MEDKNDVIIKKGLVILYEVLGLFFKLCFSFLVKWILYLIVILILR